MMSKLSGGLPLGKVILITAGVAILLQIGKCYPTWKANAAARRAAEPTSSDAAVGTTESRNKTVVAKPNEWSERVSVPFGQVGNIRPKGKIRVKTASGKEWDDWEGRAGEVEKLSSAFDQMFQFKSLETKEVNVTVEWEPK